MTTCGVAPSTEVRVFNNAAQDDVRNVITVSSGGSSSSVTVFHVVQLDRFIVTSSLVVCPPFGKDEPLFGITLFPEDSERVGTVDYSGCKNAPSGCQFSCQVRAEVRLLSPVGLTVPPRNATWTANVPGPCP